jgi:4'-phosphopantetheinyl transferase
MTMADGYNIPECHVFWAQVDTSRSLVRHLLDTSERDRARAYRHVPDQARFVAGRGLARLAVAQLAGIQPQSVVFEALCRHCAGPHGRLETVTPDGVLNVSISHSGNRVGVALAWGIRCGLDIERVALRGGAVPRNALSQSENAMLDRLPQAEQLPAFIQIWTRKEAVLKATGDGLVISPADLTVSPPSHPAKLVVWHNRPAPHTEVHLLDLAVGPVHRASLATLCLAVNVVQREADICWLTEMSAPL